MLGPIVSKEFLISAKIDGITFKIAENGTENGKCILVSYIKSVCTLYTLGSCILSLAFKVSEIINIKGRH